MSLLISKRAAQIASIAALPFIVIADYCYIHAILETRWPEDAILYGIYGTLIFMLGSPLTALYMFGMPYLARFLDGTIGTQLGFLVPVVYSVLFFAQWLIWSQLIVWVYRKFRKKLT